jgi:gluconate 2-dehydrogenase gamma chain
MTLEQMDRRRFLKSAAGGTVVLASGAMLGTTAENGLASGCKVLTAYQASLLGMAADQIVPADDYPGGRLAGVVFHIDRILAGHFGNFYRDRYERGLRVIDQLSHKSFGHDFVSLDSEQQVSLLKALESGAAPEPGREFFALLLQHTMEGYYGDPEHGGNRNHASWKMIGFEG